jgi:hypothetical protein
MSKISIHKINDRDSIRRAAQLIGSLPEGSEDYLVSEVDGELANFYNDPNVPLLLETLQNGTAIDLLKVLTGRSDICQRFLEIANETHEEFSNADDI